MKFDPEDYAEALFLLGWCLSGVGWLYLIYIAV